MSRAEANSMRAVAWATSNYENSARDLPEETRRSRNISIISSSSVLSCFSKSRGVLTLQRV